jgi:signal peptidase I
MSLLSILKSAFTTRKPRVASGTRTRDAVYEQTFRSIVTSGDASLNIALVANTNSMVPTLDANSVVVFERVDFAQLTEGDIVIYDPTPGLRVIHRLYEKTVVGWNAKGDNNARIDPWIVTAANLEGRVVGVLYSKREADTDL